MRNLPKLKISIAMCVYNGGLYLSEQLESFIDQLGRDDELVICDDGSTDNSIDIITKFQKKVSFTIMLHKNLHNLGTTKNFEQCIKLCSGDIIFLCDQDDVWHRDKVNKILKVFEDNSEVGLVFSNANVSNEDGALYKHKLWDSMRCNKKIISQIKAGDAFNIFLRKNYATGATVAFRKSLVNKIIPIPSSWIHDHYIAFVVSAISKVYPLSDCLIDYRQHSMQQIGGAGDMFFNKVILRLGRKKNLHRKYAFKVAEAIKALENKNIFSEDQLYKMNELYIHLNYRNNIINYFFFKRLFLVTFNIKCYLKYVDGLYDAVSDILNI